MPTATILLVDDETLFRGLAASFLRESGYEVHEAADGYEALERLRAFPYDLVLLDLVMPRMGGWDVLAHFRKVPAIPRTIVVTGAHEIVTPGTLGQYVCGYLAKPFRGDELLRACEVVLEAPRTLPASGRRAEQRRTFVVGATIRSHAAPPTTRGQIVQLSLGGFELETRLELDPGETVLVSFNLPGRDQLLNLKGVVRWRGYRVFGATIEDLQPEEADVLRELVTV